MERLKKLTLFLLIGFLTFVKIDVLACGEIDELRSNVGNVTVLDESNYLITVPQGTKEVTLSGTTRYAWVESYAPRKVSTQQTVELKVDGNACGYGIYTYFVKFKEISNIIAENDQPDTQTKTETTPAPSNDDPATPSPEEGGAPTGSGTLLLKNLEITSYDIDFDPLKYDYTFEVGMDVKNLDILAEPEDSAVVVSISSNAYSLKDGENLIAITLRDMIGNTNVYNLTVNRVEPKSDNNYLNSITIAGHQLNFDPGITLYNLEIGKESTLNISVETESKLAKYEILGNSALQSGSTITIRVTAEDGSTRDYLLSITRVFNIMDYWIYILIILLLLLIIIIVVIMNQKKNKKKLGPGTISAPESTAGIVQEIAPQNSAPQPTATIEPNAVQMGAATEKGKLQIIEPTDIETVPVDEVDDKTEIFQL